MALILANGLSLPATGRLSDWLSADPLSRAAFFRHDFTKGRHAEGGRVVSWPGGWTQVRDSMAYYTTSNGALVAASDDVMRVKHFDVEEMVRVLLMEKGTTNQVLYPVNISLGVNEQTGVTLTDDASTAPDGTNSATTLIEDSSLGYHRFNTREPHQPGTIYTHSAYVKPVGANRYLHWVIQVGSDAIGAVFDLQNETVPVQGKNADGVFVSASIEPVSSSGFYRISVSGIPVSSSAVSYSPYNQLYLVETLPASITGPNTHQGDGASGIVIWGWQVEAGEAASSVIPAQGRASRDGDKLYRTDLASFPIVDSLSAVMKAKMPVASEIYSRFFQFDTAVTQNDRSAVQFANGNIELVQYVAGANKAYLIAPHVLGEEVNIGSSFGVGAGAASLVLDGVKVGANSPDDFASPTRLSIAASDDAASRKPDQLAVRDILAHAGLTDEQLIDETAPVKTVAKIEGVTPLLDLDFENMAFSMDGKARGLSNILTHARDSAAIGVLSDGRYASHPDDLPRLEWSEGVRACRMEGAQTNTCSNYNANPTDLTGVTGNAVDLGLVTVVDDTDALVEAGLGSICSSGNVFKVVNTTGNPVFANFGLTQGNNAQTVSTFYRSDGEVAVGAAGATSYAASDTYVRASRTTFVDSTIAYFRVSAGTTAYFILNQLEERGIATSPIATQGSSQSRALDNLYVPFGDLGLGIGTDFALMFDIACWAQGSSERLFAISETNSVGGDMLDVRGAAANGYVYASVSTASVYDNQSALAYDVNAARFRGSVVLKSNSVQLLLTGTAPANLAVLSNSLSGTFGDLMLGARNRSGGASGPDLSIFRAAIATGLSVAQIQAWCDAVPAA